MALDRKMLKFGWHRAMAASLKPEQSTAAGWPIAWADYVVTVEISTYRFTH